MASPTREWPWPWDGYTTVRLFVVDVLPPTRDQVVSHVDSVVRTSRTVTEVGERIGAFHSPYLPLAFRLLSHNDRPDAQPGHLDIEVRVRRR